MSAGRMSANSGPRIPELQCTPPAVRALPVDFRPELVDTTLSSAGKSSVLWRIHIPDDVIHSKL